MNFDAWRRRADAVRGQPLEVVRRQWGAAPDPRDKTKWRTERGALSLTGSKFHNWREQTGGGGAIDLVMHLGGLDFRQAVVWLEQHLGVRDAAAPVPTCSTPAIDPSPPRLWLPVPCLGNLRRVRRYLTETRRLIDRGYHICCGYDTDEAGEHAAAAMIATHPSVQRLRPAAHDWNDALIARVS